MDQMSAALKPAWNMFAALPSDTTTMKTSGDPPYFSIVIPAHNEEETIQHTCEAIINEFQNNNIADYEILVVNDNSVDQTEARLRHLTACYPVVRYVNNAPPSGFGLAVRKGLDHYRGEIACVVMADLSDAPADIVRYYRKIGEGWECIFGSRFMKGSRVIGYPKMKRLLNRLINRFIQVLFWIDHNDITNPFKCYRRHVIDGIRPIISNHFNLEVELPLKSIVRGYTWTKIPISWTNRDAGVSKFKIMKLAGRYMFILACVFFEKLLARKDYIRKDALPPQSSGSSPSHGQ
jgi:dolichol-phosphate mannosyltransferase